MNIPFQLSRGIGTTLDDSGIAFKPVAGYTMAQDSDRKWTHVFRVACSIDDLEPLIAALVDVCLPESFYAILCGHWFDDRIDTYSSESSRERPWLASILATANGTEVNTVNSL